MRTRPVRVVTGPRTSLHGTERTNRNGSGPGGKSQLEKKQIFLPWERRDEWRNTIVSRKMVLGQRLSGVECLIPGFRLCSIDVPSFPTDKVLYFKSPPLWRVGSLRVPESIVRLGFLFRTETLQTFVSKLFQVIGFHECRRIFSDITRTHSLNPPRRLVFLPSSLFSSLRPPSLSCLWVPPPDFPSSPVPSNILPHKSKTESDTHPLEYCQRWRVTLQDYTHLGDNPRRRSTYFVGLFLCPLSLFPSLRRPVAGPLWHKGHQGKDRFPTLQRKSIRTESRTSKGGLFVNRSYKGHWVFTKVDPIERCRRGPYPPTVCSPVSQTGLWERYLVYSEMDSQNLLLFYWDLLSVPAREWHL